MTTLLTEKQATNNLTFKTSKTLNGATIYVSIKLNDECKNGHQDFSITGDLYYAGKPKINKYMISCGCIHDKVIKFYPEFKIFIDLHNCDYAGIPMYAVENGFYNLTNGFNSTKVEDSNFKEEYCDYYRISADQYDILKTSKNKTQFSLYLQKLGILTHWQDQANKAIKVLEGMTGKSFLIDSVKTQYHAPTEQEVKAEEDKCISGYYTQEAEQSREVAKRNGIFNKLRADMDKGIKKLTTEFEVKVQVLTIGGEKALNNCIWYNHSNTLGFNWKSYDNISDELVNKITTEIKLPEGAKIENKAK